MEKFLKLVKKDVDNKILIGHSFCFSLYTWKGQGGGLSFGGRWCISRHSFVFIIHIFLFSVE